MAVCCRPRKVRICRDSFTRRCYLLYDWTCFPKRRWTSTLWCYKRRVGGVVYCCGMYGCVDALASAGIEMYGLVVGTVALVPAQSSGEQRVLLDPSSADIGLVTGMKTSTRVLLCGMPALASVTCLNVSAGSTQLSSAKKDPGSNAVLTAGLDGNTLDPLLRRQTPAWSTSIKSWLMPSPTISSVEPPSQPRRTKQPLSTDTLTNSSDTSCRV